MARVTIEDCAKVVGNKFDLVLFAAQRVRQILTGGSLLIKEVDAPREKNTVIALRDIGSGNVDVETLRDKLVMDLREFAHVASDGEETDDEEEDTYDPYLALAAMEEGAVISVDAEYEDVSGEDEDLIIDEDVDPDSGEE